MGGEVAYRLVTYQGAHGPVAAVLVADEVVDCDTLLGGTDIDATSVLALLRSWPAADARLRDALTAGRDRQGISLEDVSLLAPLPAPPSIFCAGANYWDHLEEMEGSVDRGRRVKDPWFFIKTTGSVTADGAPVHGPTASHQLDWEAELAVVIGTKCRNVTADRAHQVVAGYTIVNDLSARDLMMRTDRPPAMTYDWVGQKCFDGALPMGPWLTPAAAIPDVHALGVRLWVNDELKQNSNTNNLIHDVYEQIEWLSHQLTLMPGDVICTGTPAGVGMPRGTFLQPGDVVRIEIDALGTLTTPIVAAPGAPQP